MPKRTTPWPRCNASSWRGECGTVVARDESGEPDASGRCEFHNANPVHAEDVSGEDLPAETLEAAEVELPETERDLSRRIGNIRGQLRQDVSTEEVYELIRDSLVAALAATRESWMTCGSCKKKQPVVLPDLGTRVNAIDKLLNQTLGKIEESKSGQNALERLGEKPLSLMSLDEKQLFLAELEAKAATECGCECHASKNDAVALA